MIKRSDASRIFLICFIRRNALFTALVPAPSRNDLLFLAARKKKEQKERCIGF